MNKSVLLIDDENDLCKLLSTGLHKEGYAVTCVGSLAEASLALLKHHDIVLLDNNLPDGTGLAFLQMHPSEFMKSYVVMISADASTDLQKKASEEGIQQFLPKPFSIARIREILKKAC